MWKATRDKDVVYLLGTVHAGKEDFYPLAPEIDKALEECKALIVEIAIDKVDLNKMKVTATSKATYSPPDKLSAHLSAPTKRIFDDYLAWAGESWEMYEKYRPWFVRSLIGASPRWSTETIRSRLGIDRYLIGRARELKKDVLDLETPDFQLKISADLPENLQDKLLAVSILDLKNSGNDVKNIVYAWKGGDSEKMYDVVTRDMREYPELTPYYKRLVDDRNVSMTKTLTELFAKSSGPYLVAVGAGHLVGKTGLVSQFKERGYTVEQCNTDMRASDSSISPDVKKFVKRFKNPDGKAPGAPGSNVEKPAGNITRSSGQQ